MQTRKTRRETWRLAGLLVLATVLVYLPSVFGGFIWDDDTLVTRNPAVKTADGLYSIWFTSWTGDYIPLTLTSFWLEWHVWKDNPAGYHIVNILLHGANAALLWRILARLRVKGAWLAALLFAVHPVCAASVTWIAEQKNTLSMFFYLASLLLFLRDDEGVGATHLPRGNIIGIGAGRCYWRSVGFFALALMAKSAVVILPAVLLLCAWWRRGEISKRELLRTVPFFVLAALFSAIAILIQHKALRTGVAAAQDPLWIRMIGGSWALWFYLGKILAPVNLTMIYRKWQIDANALVSYAPAFLFAGMTALFFWKGRGWGRPFLFAVGYFVIALSPVLGVFRLAFFANAQVADHFQYFAMPGILALVAAGVVELPRLLAAGGPLTQVGRGSRRARASSQRGLGGRRQPPKVVHGVNEPPGTAPQERRPTESRVVGRRSCGAGAERFLGSLALPSYDQPGVFVRGMAVACAIVLSGLTWQREGILGHSEKLWEDNAAKNQTSWRVYMNLNLALLESGKTNEAIQMYNKANALLERKAR